MEEATDVRDDVEVAVVANWDALGAGVGLTDDDDDDGVDRGRTPGMAGTGVMRDADVAGAGAGFLLAMLIVAG